MSYGSYKISIKLFFVMSALLLLSSCASQTKYTQLTVEAVKAGETTPDLESAYQLISNIKSPENIIIIYDASGSMHWPTVVDGEPRYKTAHKALTKYVAGIKEKHNVGLIVFGSRYASGIFGGKINNLAAAKKSCNTDIDVVVPLAKFNRDSFAPVLDQLSQYNSYKGDTPIGNAIMKAVESLKSAPGERKHIILITDGEEECYSKDSNKAVPGSMSPEKAVKMATENGILVNIVAHGIGRGKGGVLIGKSEAAIRSLKNLVTGVFIEASAGEDIMTALMKVELESFYFDVLGPDGKVVAKSRIGKPTKIDLTPYSLMNFSLANGNRIKFTLSTQGEQTFKKSIALSPDESKANVILGLKSSNDSDPLLGPPNLVWKEK